jgi:hypothetical protein
MVKLRKKKNKGGGKGSSSEGDGRWRVRAREENVKTKSFFAFLTPALNKFIFNRTVNSSQPARVVRYIMREIQWANERGR